MFEEMTKVLSEPPFHSPPDPNRYGDTALHGKTWVLESTARGYWPLWVWDNEKSPQLGWKLETCDATNKSKRHEYLTSCDYPAPGRPWWLFYWSHIVLVLAFARWAWHSRFACTRSGEIFDDTRFFWILISCCGAALVFLNLPMILFWLWSPNADIQMAAWRAMAISSGVSPLVPVILLLTAISVWIYLILWCRSLGKYRDPGLPLPTDPALHESMRIMRDRFGDLSNQASLSSGLTVPVCTVIAILLLQPWRSLATLNGGIFWMVLSGLVGLAVLSVIGTCIKVCRTWSNVSRVLTKLEHMNLDGAFRRIPKEFSVSMWLQAPTRRIYLPLFYARDVLAELTHPGLAKLDETLAELRRSETDQRPDGHIYKAATAQCIAIAEDLLKDNLEPAWRSGVRDPDPQTETTLPDNRNLPSTYRSAADFVALRYAAWIRYVMVHMRNMVWYLSLAYTLLALALNSLTFQGPETIRYFLWISFFLTSLPVIAVMVQVERNAVVSRMANTTVGSLSVESYFKVGATGLLPLLGLLSHNFPGIAHFLTSWLEPSLAQLK
jgi:hypothetical protein